MYSEHVCRLTIRSDWNSGNSVAGCSSLFATRFRESSMSVATCERQQCETQYAVFIVVLQQQNFLFPTRRLEKIRGSNGFCPVLRGSAGTRGEPKEPGRTAKVSNSSLIGAEPTPPLWARTHHHQQESCMGYLVNCTQTHLTKMGRAAPSPGPLHEPFTARHTPGRAAQSNCPVAGGVHPTFQAPQRAFK